MSALPRAPGTILEVMGLFPQWFTGASWAAWRVLLAAIFGLSLEFTERECYTRLTGRTTVTRAREAFLIIGRRGGKSLVAALCAVYVAVFRDWRAVLRPGESGVIMVIAADRRQARVVFRYILALLESLPWLAPLITKQTRDAIHFTTGIVIEIHTASFRSTRGYTVLTVILDEVAFWRDETSANPDVEILHALRPAMATIPGALLLAISSPYARRGILWGAFKGHYGRDGDPVLVAKADSATMNPTLDPAVIQAAYEADEAAARAEWGAEFRRDVESFIDREAVDAVVVPGRRELPPLDEVAYLAFNDPASGSGQDEYALAIAHAERRAARWVFVVDLVRSRKPPFSPEAVTAEYGAVCRSYHVREVVGDRYAGEWPREQWRKAGVAYRAADRPKSEYYRDALPLITSGAVELLDQPRALTQLANLERRTARGGRDSIDHAPGSHDDLANVIAGALVLAALAPQRARGDFELAPAWDLEDDPDAEDEGAQPADALPRSRWMRSSFAPARWPDRTGGVP